MADSLVLRLWDDSTACEWVVVDADGRQTEPRRSGPLSEVRAAATGRRLIVLVPGPAVVTTKVELPQVSKARMRQMLPFSLEDQFAEDVSSLHFAAGSRDADGLLFVSVVAQERLAGWLDRLATEDLEPAAVYADSDGVADTPATLNVIWERGTILARRPGDAAIAIEGLSLADAFSIIADDPEQETTVQHALLCIDPESHEANSAQIEAAATQFASLDVKLLPEDALPLFAAKLVNHPGTNLLQGPYAPKSNWGAMLQPWRVAAMLAGGLVATMLLGTIVDYMRLQSTDADLTSTLETRCSEQFRVADLSQCEAAVAGVLRESGEPASGGNEEFLATLASIAETTTTANMLRSVSYRNSVMDMQIVTPDVPALDTFSRQLDETGPFTVSVQSTNPQEDGTVESRIQIVGENR